MPIRVNVRRGKIKTEDRRGREVPISTSDENIVMGYFYLSNLATSQVFYGPYPQGAKKLQFNVFCENADVSVGLQHRDESEGWNGREEMVAPTGQDSFTGEMKVKSQFGDVYLRNDTNGPADVWFAAKIL